MASMRVRIRRDDEVVVISGKDRGKSGKVLSVFPGENRVVVEGLNLVKRHRRARRQDQKGEVVSVPRQVADSSVMLVCRHCKKPSRMGIKHEEKKIIRICKKCGLEI